MFLLWSVCGVREPRKHLVDCGVGWMVAGFEKERKCGTKAEKTRKVEWLLDRRLQTDKKGRYLEYLVKWDGVDESHNSWYLL